MIIKEPTVSGTVGSGCDKHDVLAGLYLTPVSMAGFLYDSALYITLISPYISGSFG
jgi:hypothetical protein